MHICTHFFAVPMNNQRNSHTEAGESTIHILLLTPLVPFTSLPSSCFNTLGPKPWYGFSDPNSLCSKTSNFLHRTPCFYYTYTFMVLCRKSSLPKCRVRAQSPATKQSQHFCRTLSFCGHRSVTCSETTPLTDAVLKAPSWNPLPCHMKGWTHTIHGYGQKQLPATSSNSLQRDLN